MTIADPVRGTPEAPVAPDVPFGALLRDWRRRRGLSQLELALRADSSARHLSFLETGRARPSQAMVLRLADHLDVPVRERNTLLVAAGHAPAYPETPLRDAAMAPLRAELDRLLVAYEPNPALVLDGTHDVLAANAGVRALLAGVDEVLLRPPLNALRITLHPRGLAPRIDNLAEWRDHLLGRVRHHLALRSSPELRAVYEEVAGYPAPAPARDGVAAAGYALPMRITVAGRRLSFLSTVTTFNTPLDVTVSELAVETFLPADPETARALPELVAETAVTPAAAPGRESR
ncbi:helix-turn-helix domain-containing protein [Streptomyces hainanensis]|uniref:XRE family transcriptional regulator n=1 Tax=Streptomyces hainanensis TaxID=402648 RepID=A0A4V2Y1M3_9ACTN|nr:helix-turn-helix transcriptional regulator [Streptomyces hainanensis]TDC69325.1 XRE family transcriptional regulator [Streptomyces hainanensis]